MIRLPESILVLLGGIPRESGDDPDAISELELEVLYSPRERG